MRMLPAAVVAAALATFAGPTVASSRAADALPLAYVRRLAIAPVALLTPTDPPLPAEPPPFITARAAAPLAGAGRHPAQFATSRHAHNPGAASHRSADPRLTSAPASAARAARARAVKAHARWAAAVKARADLQALRTTAVAAVAAELARQTPRIEGLEVSSNFAGEATSLWQPALPDTASARGSARSVRRLRPSATALAAFLSGRPADAALVVGIDRVGRHVGLEREVWVRTVAFVSPVAGSAEGPALRGPYFAFGAARAGRPLFGHVAVRPDSALADAAAAQAVRRLVHTLRTGEEIPFARARRIAILPADVPTHAEKWVSMANGYTAPGAADLDSSSPPAGHGALQAAYRKVAVDVPALGRESDVLLQPELGPVVVVLTPEEVHSAMRRVGATADKLWSGGRLDRDRVLELAHAAGADYVFVSRVTGIEFTADAADAVDGPVLRPGTIEHVDAGVAAALLDTRTGVVVWQDESMGGTVAATEYVRHTPRLRTDDACVMDAVRTAYAHLRYAFDQTMRRYEE